MAHWKAFARPNTLVASIPNMGAMGQYGLTKGVFDLIVITPQIGCGFLELKTDKRRNEKARGMSPDQDAFKLLCITNNVRCAVAYGRDEPIQVLEHWGAVKPQTS